MRIHRLTVRIILSLQWAIRTKWKTQNLLTELFTSYEKLCFTGLY